MFRDQVHRSGQVSIQPPHVNTNLVPDRTEKTAPLCITSSGGTGLFVKTPVVEITANVINGVIEAWGMALHQLVKDVGRVV